MSGTTPEGTAGGGRLDEATRRALDRTHEWFATNSGWAPPDEDTLREWVADGVCRAPDDCLVEPESWCRHGLASWLIVLRTVEGWPEPGSRRVRRAGQPGGPGDEAGK